MEIEKIKEVIKKKAKKYGVNPLIIESIIEIESNYNPKAIGKYGEIGLMQILPKAHPQFDIKKGFDIEYNIEYGTRYIRELIDKYGEQGISAVISAYNAGHPTTKNLDYVIKVMNKIITKCLTLQFLKYV